MWDPLPLRMLPLLAVCLGPHLLAQAPTTRLEGLVLDPLSQPVANARITVEVDGDEIAHTQSDALGTFVLARLPAQAVVVRATTAVPDVGATVVDLFTEPRGFARIHVMPARQVAGTVRDDAGKAIAGAWVVCTPTGTEEFGCVGSHTQSDGEGRFALTHVPFGKIALRAWAPGLAGFAADVDGTADATIVCTLAREDVQERAFDLVGATPEQRAAARLEVSAWADSAELLLPPPLRHPAIGADGTWQVPGWSHDDAMQVKVVLAGARVGSIRIDPGSTIPRRHLYVEDADDTFVQCKLTSTDGLPTGGVQLVADGLWVEKTTRTTVITNADGTFALPSPVARGDSFVLRCLDPGLALRDSQAREAEERLRSGARGQHDKSKVQEFPLLRARSLRCVVRDAEGLPFPGAEVTLLGPGRRQVTHVVQGGERIDYLQASVLARGRGGIDGTVEVAQLDLREGETIVCQVAGPRGFLERELVVTQEIVQDLGELRTDPGATLLGHVLTADGKPFAGARLQIENWNGCERSHFVASDRSGTFRLLGLMPGPCRIRVVGQRTPQRAATLTEGDVTEITLQ